MPHESLEGRNLINSMIHMMYFINKILFLEVLLLTCLLLSHISTAFRTSLLLSHISTAFGSCTLCQNKHTVFVQAYGSNKQTVTIFLIDTEKFFIYEHTQKDASSINYICLCTKLKQMPDRFLSSAKCESDLLLYADMTKIRFHKSELYFRKMCRIWSSCWKR